LPVITGFYQFFPLSWQKYFLPWQKANPAVLKVDEERWGGYRLAEKFLTTFFFFFSDFSHFFNLLKRPAKRHPPPPHTPARTL
jgi:hypothetical protein